MGEKLTRNDIKKIQEEIEHRKLVLRPKLIDAVKEARAQGDLSENFEYYAAKREKNQNESRIRYLDKILRFSELVKEEEDEKKAGLGKKVKIKFEDDGSIQEVRIVTAIRGQSLEGRISTDSPLGKALLGHSLGDRVLVKINDSLSYYVEILDIELDNEDYDIRKF